MAIKYRAAQRIGPTRVPSDDPNLPPDIYAPGQMAVPTAWATDPPVPATISPISLSTASSSGTTSSQNSAATSAAPAQSRLSHALSSSSSSPILGANPTALILPPSSLGHPLSSVPTSASPTPSPSQTTQNSSVGTGETNKLVIGLVVAIVITISLAMTGLAYFCVMRKRRRSNDVITKAPKDENKAGSEGEKPQLYLQPKAKLDDEQRRHEMEAVDLRYEMDGEDMIHEMQVEGSKRNCGG